MVRMNICGRWLGLLFLLCVTSIFAQPEADTWNVCRYPVRVLGKGQTVDLTPLYQWWARQPMASTNSVPGGVVAAQTISAGTNSADANGGQERPMTAWYRVRGTRVATLGSSWVLNAAIFTSPTLYTNARIVLNHPPEQEEQVFSTLTNQLAALNQQIFSVDYDYRRNTNAESDARAAADRYRHANIKAAGDAVAGYSRLAVEKHNEAARELTQLDQLQAQRTQLEKELAAIPSVDGNYLVDWFAARLGNTRQGWPLFDRGLAVASPP